MKVQYPLTVGQSVTLGIKHWAYDKGAAGTVVKMRRDKQCGSGLRVWVSMNGSGRVLDLDARWFNEIPEKFQMPSQIGDMSLVASLRRAQN